MEGPFRIMSLEWILSPQRIAGAATLVVGYAALCARVAWVSRRKRQDLSHGNEEAAGHSQWPAVLVCYASQTGQAEGIAREAAGMLRASGMRATLMPVDAVGADVLRSHERSLWVLSTTGEGDAPDHALPFVQALLPQSLSLPAHQSQVLALGDREYRQFCAFGEQVHRWLEAQGASSEMTCVDNMDRDTLRAWQARMNERKLEWLGVTDSQPPAPDEEEWLLPPASTLVRLERRTLLNPRSQGGPLYQLDWVAESGRELPHWESGDLASLRVPADPEHPRDYSIASIPRDNVLQMLVRLSVREDGTPGVASGWLCGGIREGDSLEVSVRRHSSFRLGDSAERPLILIGNGSGLAGLLGHVRARIAWQQGDQWLIFGERSPVHDALLDQQLQGWLRSGQLARLDRAWSRDGDNPRRYVQDVVLEQAEAIRAWVARGAAIFVCGSLQGMGQGVHKALRQVLGEEALHALIQSGRYRRDVY